MTKTTQTYLLILVAVISAAAFFFLGGKPNMDELKKSVAPAASLYPRQNQYQRSSTLSMMHQIKLIYQMLQMANGRFCILATLRVQMFVLSISLK